MSRILYAFLACCFVTQIQAQNLPKLNGVTLGPGVERYKEKAKDTSVFILTYHTTEAAATARKQLQQKGLPFEGPKFKELPMQGVKATGADVEWLAQLPGAYGIWQNRKINGDLHQAIIASRVKNVREDAAFTSLNGGLPITGRGVGVLVNDSGFDGDSTDIEARDVPGRNRRVVQNVKSAGVISWLEDFGSDNGANYDTDQGGGHGSHCMGIVGGDGHFSNEKFTGVAPGTYLIGYGSGAALSILDVQGGFEYAVRHAKDYNIRVTSNSFGSTSDTTFTSLDLSDPTNIATKFLADRGIMVVFSAGNSGPNAGTITGNWKTAPWVIAVGNGLKTGPLASSSSRGRPQGGDVNTQEAMQASINVNGKNYLWENRPTVTAPGTDIISVRATTGPIGYLGISDEVSELTASELPYYAIMTGTSMACPHIAGVTALMLEANPNLEWRAIKAILQRTAVPMQEKKWQAGAGYVNAHAAVAAAFFGLCDAPAGSNYEQKYGLPTDGNFGFATDPWKTCPLNQEVIVRMSTTMPSLTGAEPLCSSDITLTDATGAADVNGGTVPPNPPPFFDIKEVQVTTETATTFDITLKVQGNLVASPPGGPSPTAQHYYDVHFVLDKINPEGTPPAPQVAYIVSSWDLAGVKNFRLTVRTADGTTRPNTNVLHYEVITGSWNTNSNTIKWTVPKASLNVSKIPASTSTAGERLGRGAKAGDRLKSWESYIYDRAAVATPDGPGVYNDKANGQCFKVLQQ